MGRILEVMFGAWLLLGLVSGVSAQGVVNYPPASGNMVYVPPSSPAPEAFGSPYVETFPSFAGSFDSTAPTLFSLEFPTPPRPDPQPPPEYEVAIFGPRGRTASRRRFMRCNCPKVSFTGPTRS